MADVISRLRLESGEFDSKIKRAGQELLAYSSHCRKMGLEMGYANKDAQDFARQLGSMATVSQTARGKISELSEAFVNAKVMYKNMTDEEKNNTFGKNLAASLDQLKIRIEAAKQDFEDVNKELAGGGKFGEFGNVINTLGSKLGVTGNLTEMLTSKTAMLTGAVGAGIAIVSKATEAWAGYNAELAKQDQITTVTTGLKGDDANRMTDTMRALSDTYNVDFRESINAANTLMTQFGKTGDEAVQIIKDGMQGMIQGDGPKLLSMIQQYAPAFRDAGVSASQLVAVIQNSEGGIFTDQNMNAIVMGIKNIRLMTKATSDALAQLGIDGQKMSQQLSNGSLTIFDALKQVAAAVQNVNSNSQAAGEVMQQVFGRQGAMAGIKLGEAIATLNTNLEETKRQTGEVGGALAELQTANERLNTAIRDCFEYDGWDNMANGIKTNLVTALATVLEYIGRIKNSLSDFLATNGIKGSGGYSDIEKTRKWINNGKDDNERRSRYDQAMGQLQTKLNNVGKERLVRNSDGSTSYVIDDEETQAKKRAALQKRMSMLYATSFTPKTKEPPRNPITPLTPTKTTTGGNTERNLDEEQKVQAKINALLKDALTADANRQGEIRQQVAELQKQQEKYKDIKNIAQGILPKDKEAVFTIDGQLTEETKKALSDIKGVTIDDKSLTITANTSDALKALQGIEGVTIDPKTVTITATDEAMPKLREIDGITIDDKTMTVTAETSDALRALQAIEGVTIDPKTVTITATDEALPKLREIQGITIDDKTMTVTADTQEAMQKVQELIGVVSETKLMPIKPVITDDDIDNLLRKQYGQAIEVPVVPKMSAGEELVQSIRLDLAQSIQDADMQTLRTLLEAQIKNGIEGIEIPANSIIDQIFGEGADIPDEYWQNLQDQINEKLKEMGIDPINIDFSTGKAKDDKGSSDNEFKEFNAKAGQFISGLANVSNGLKGLGLQLPEGVDQLLGAISSVMQVIQGVNTVISVFSASAMTSNTAAIIANTAALYANSFLSVFANGGIAHAANGWSGTVPGTSYSGDNIPIMVNSGELILNRAQQGNIASQLEGGGLGDLQLELRVDAEELIIMLNNNGKRRGLGRLING